MKKDWRLYAHHILDAIDKIERIQQRGDILQDDILYDAAIRNLQTLSEATQAISVEQQAQYPDIPWRDISGFRNILVHDYLGDIDPLTIKAVIQQHLPALQHCMQALLNHE
ncbi:MAG: DUF86 domain-containing protein [Zetaproteobacteria bacterium]|nr:DUF86 domain-containing protein [Zetaproteobacteria bacterium]